MKKGSKKKIIINILLLVIILIVGIFLAGWYIGEWGFKGYYFYKMNNKENECGAITVYHGDNDTTTTYYPNGKVKNNNKDESNKKKECLIPGYHINKNKVNINIGSMTCGHNIKISELKVDKNMNVYIKAQERKGISEAWCLCSPNLTLYFYKNVNSVTLVNEDGTKLGECK